MTGIRKAIQRIRAKLEISDYYLLLEAQISIAKERWGGKTKRSAFHLMMWNLKALLKHHFRTEEICRPRKVKKSIEANRITMLVRLCGGVGDKLILLNYLYLMKVKYQGPAPLEIDVVISSGKGVTRAIAQEGNVFRNVFPEFGGDPAEYDVYLDSTGRYLKLCNWDKGRVTRLLPQLAQYLESGIAFEERFRNVFAQKPLFDALAPAITRLAGNRKRICQPDFDGTLGVEEDFRYPPFLSEESGTYLTSLGLENGQFLTIHRGCDTYYKGDVVKMWPEENYRHLLLLLKRTYPDLKIVQMGASKEKFPQMDGCDIYTVGKTTMEQVKILLKHSALHIDCEGGYVHLRQWLGGGTSVVLFGPTSSSFYGYENNINIQGQGCTQPCEWLTKDWTMCCPRGFKSPPCMDSITPEIVMDQIRFHRVIPSKAVMQ